jgi:hypothetical protein
MRSITWHDTLWMYVHYWVCKLMGDCSHRNWKTQHTCNLHMELKTHKWIVPCTPWKLQPNCSATQRLCNLPPRKLYMVALHNSCLISFVIIFALFRGHGRSMKPQLAFVQLNEHHWSLFDKTHLEGQSGFGMGKNFTWLEGAWFLY